MTDISRWNFEADDDGLLVCKGGHEKHEHCEAHMERLSPHEVLKLINELRAEVMRAKAYPCSDLTVIDLMDTIKSGFEKRAQRAKDAREEDPSIHNRNYWLGVSKAYLDAAGMIDEAVQEAGATHGNPN